MDKQRDWQRLYREERRRNGDLVRRLALAEEEKEELAWKLGRIKNSKIWKCLAPARGIFHASARMAQRIGRLGGPRALWRKLGAKRREWARHTAYGTGSFPDLATRKAQSERVFKQNICFSILVPLYNTPRGFLEQMLDSVLWQTYGNWQLCLADGSDREHAYVGEICRQYADRAGGRIVYEKLPQNLGISGNTNRCMALASGEYLGLFDHDDILHPSVLYEYALAIEAQGADYLYCDETTFAGDDINRMLTMHFKPDFAIDNLRANNYICHFSVFSRSLLDGEELFCSRYDGSQDHDAILRLTARAQRIVHVPKLLYYWRSHAGSVASGIEAKAYAVDAAKGAVARHLESQGFSDFVISSTRAFETIFRISYALEDHPLVSILIPSKDHVDDLRRCILSIQEKSTYGNWEIIVAENNSVEPATFAYYRELEAQGVRILRYQGEFHYSRINNMAAAQAGGEYLLLLNNDTEVISPNWIEELLMYAQRPDVGAVGAKLLYPDQTIQHAGVVIGLGAHRTAGHSHYGQSRDNLGYMGRLCYAQNVSAVTGACLMVKRRHYEELDGLSEEFAVALNDVDFCLRLRQRGYLNVFTPFARLYHHESLSRGGDGEGEKKRRYEAECALFREKWREVLEAGDPYYNPNFSLDRSDFALR